MGADETQGVFAAGEADGDFYGRGLIVGGVGGDAATDFGVVGFAGMLVLGGAGRTEGEAILIMADFLISEALYRFEIMITGK